MFNMRSILYGWLIAGACSVAEADTVLTDYLSPRADAYLFFSNRETEKNVAPALWKRIEKERKAVASASHEEDDRGVFFANFLKRMQDHDASVVFNIYLFSLQKPSGVIEGVAEFSGNLAADFEALQKQDPMLKIEKSGRYQIYRFEVPGRLDIKMILMNANTVHFRIDLNCRNPLPFIPLPARKQHVEVEEIDFMKQMFVFGCHADRIARLLPSRPEKTAELKKMLSDVSVFTLTGRVAEKNLHLISRINFSQKEKMKQVYQAAEKTMRIVFSSAPLNMFFPELNIVQRTENLLQISSALNLEKAWDAMMLLPGGTRNPVGNNELVSPAHDSGNKELLESSNNNTLRKEKQE